MRLARVHSHVLRFTQNDRAEGYYRYLPFSLETDAEGLHVSLDYDRRDAVVDLGLLDPGGFRGWSGGERTSFAVGSAWATPGYLKGPLVDGDWAVMLGLYRVPVGGVEVRVEVRIGPVRSEPEEPISPVPPAPVLRRPPAQPGRRWVAGDLHAHSEHSDGRLSLARLAALARGQGLDFLAVTDHNTISHHAELRALSRLYRMALIPGQELTAPDGHANCLGAKAWVDFRAGADRWLLDGEARGGLLSINHPVAGAVAWRRAMVSSPALVEVWHQSWDRHGDDAIRWWQALGAGVPIGGSDYHRPGDHDGTGRELLPGSPTTWIEVEARDCPPEVDELLSGLREGRVAISAQPTGPVVVRDGDALIVCGGDGCTLVTEDRSTKVRGDLVTATAGTAIAFLRDERGEVVALATGVSAGFPTEQPDPAGAPSVAARPPVA